jgi:hypothetical protein
VPDESAPEVVWRPIEPEITHFHDIISIDLDIAADRGISDTYATVTLPLAEGERWPWQRVVLTFWGGPLDVEHRHAIPVRCTFEGVVYLRFLQDDAHPTLDEDEARQDVYEDSGLQGVPGYSQQHLSEGSRGGGAFCLWEAENSRLLGRLVRRAGRHSRTNEANGPWLRHFRTSCDELGSFEIIAGAITTERIEDFSAARSEGRDG